MHRSTIVPLGVTLALVATLGAAPAAAEPGQQRLRAGLLHAVPTDDRADGATTTELDEATGLRLSWECRLTSRVGIEAGVGVLSHDVEVTEPGLPDLHGEIDLTTVTASLNVHLLDEPSVGFYLGPVLGYAFWDDLALDGFADGFATDDEVLYGIHLGFDVPIGKQRRWGFSGAMDYLFSEVSLEGGADLGVDPVRLTAGFSYTF